MEENIKHKTKIGLYWNYFNNLSNTGLAFLVGIIMARLLSPSDYGVTLLPAVFMGFANVFIDSGFTSAMVRKPDLTEKDISTAFIYCISLGCFFYILFFLTAPYIAEFYNEPVLTDLIRVSSLTFLWGPLAMPQNILLSRKLDFKTPARISITTRVLGSVIGIFMAYLGYGLWALVISNVVSSFLTFLLLWISVKWYPHERWSKSSFNYLWGYGNKMVLSSLIDQSYNSITPIFIGKYYSTNDLGVYNRAYSYAQLPSVQATNVIKSVTFPVLSKLQNDELALSSGYRKMLKVSAFVIFPFMMLLAALAKPFIIILVTEKWIDSVIFLQILCFSMMWYPIHSLNLNLLQVKGRSDLFLKLEVWKKLLGLTVMACTLPFGLVYFVSAGIASSFISLFINTYYTGKLINVGFRKQMKDLLPTYGLSILIFCVVFGMNQFIDNLWIQLILGGLVGVGLYFGLAFLFRFSEIQEIKYMLNRKS